MSALAAAIVPAAPVLLPQLTGSTPAAGEVREAAFESIAAMLATKPDVVVVVAEASPAGWFDPSTPLGLGRIGGHSGHEDALPIPLAIGAQLLRDAGWQGSVALLGLEPGFRPQNVDLPDRSALLLMANGSARCTEKAPGSFDAGAEDFNALFTSALANGDSDQLSSLDPDLARQQWSDVVGPLAVLTETMRPLPPATLHYADQWGGVFYVCASLTATTA